MGRWLRHGGLADYPSVRVLVQLSNMDFLPKEFNKIPFGFKDKNDFLNRA